MLWELAGPGSLTTLGDAFHGGRGAVLVDASDMDEMAEDDGRRLKGRFALSGVREDDIRPSPRASDFGVPNDPERLMGGDSHGSSGRLAFEDSGLVSSS